MSELSNLLEEEGFDAHDVDHICGIVEPLLERKQAIIERLRAEVEKLKRQDTTPGAAREISIDEDRDEFTWSGGTDAE